MEPPLELVNQIVSATFDTYKRLSYRPQPNKFTILASFTLVRPFPDSNLLAGSSSEAHILPISLATGSKCLPANKLPPCGDALHDSHAEVLARRGAVRWLAQEILRDLHHSESYRSDWLRRVGREAGRSLKYCLRDGVKLYLYVSTVPCKVTVPLERQCICFDSL